MIKRVFLLSWLAVLIAPSYSQKIQGVYVGKVFSGRNVLLLKADGSKVTGAVYVSEKEPFSFTGTYNKPRLKGTILVDSSKSISIEGNLNGSSLSLTLPDATESCTFHKVSTKVGLSISDLFSSQYDMLLLGLWESFKRTDASGNDITEPGAKLYRKYDLHGTGTGRLSGTPPLPANRHYTPGSIPSQFFKWNITWQTHDGVMDITEDHSTPGVSLNVDLNLHFTMDYYFENDTLVTRSRNTNLTYWKRSE